MFNIFFVCSVYCMSVFTCTVYFYTGLPAACSVTRNDASVVLVCMEHDIRL
jgi:hypothetical protein